MNYKTKTFTLNEIKPLTYSEMVTLRNKLLYKNPICPLCETKILKPVMDHQHITSKEVLGENGAGLIRGVICNNCNQLLGKIENNSKRFLIKDLPKFLENVVKYLEQDNLPFIHPTETKRLKIQVKKSEYNKAIKAFALKYNKTIEYTKNKYKYSKYLTKSLETLFEKIK